MDGRNWPRLYRWLSTRISTLPPNIFMPRLTSRQVDAAGSASGLVGGARDSSSETSANLSLALEREEAEELLRRRPLGDSRLFA